MRVFAAWAIPGWAIPIVFGLITLYVGLVLRHSYRTGRVYFGLGLLDPSWAAPGDIRGARFILWLWLAIGIVGFILSLWRLF